MKKYTYEVELAEELPAEIPLKKNGTLTAKREWYGHSFGDMVGRIYEDGRKESCFRTDIENGSTALFDLLREAGLTQTKYRNIVNKATGEVHYCEDYYVMRHVKNHCSRKLTVTDTVFDCCINTGYEYTYEVLLVADDELKRYITNTVRTSGMFIYCLMDAVRDMEDVFEEWFESGENGFREGRDGELYILFYDDFGTEIELEFYNISEVMLCVTSIRLIEMKREIFERGKEAKKEKEGTEEIV